MAEIGTTVRRSRAIHAVHARGDERAVVLEAVEGGELARPGEQDPQAGEGEAERRVARDPQAALPRGAAGGRARRLDLSFRGRHGATNDSSGGAVRQSGSSRVHGKTAVARDVPAPSPVKTGGGRADSRARVPEDTV
jgi:hypothetical protein